MFLEAQLSGIFSFYLSRHPISLFTVPLHLSFSLTKLKYKNSLEKKSNYSNLQATLFPLKGKFLLLSFHLFPSQLPTYCKLGTMICYWGNCFFFKFANFPGCTSLLSSNSNEFSFLLVLCSLFIRLAKNPVSVSLFTYTYVHNIVI